MCNSFQMLFDDQEQTIYKQVADLPALEAQEILVKIKYTTLCGSDIHTYTGKRKEPSPIILGHEIVGEITALANDEPMVDLKGEALAIGDLITWTIFAATEEDEYYNQGIPQKSKDLFKYGHVKCTTSNVYNGGLATHCILRKGTGILKVPATVTPTLAPIINCAGATVMSAFRIIDDIKGKNVLICGAGVLGLLSAAVAKTLEVASITLMDINDQRLEMAKSFGADFTYNSLTPQENLTAITEQFYKKGFDVIIDMSGAYSAMEIGLAYSAIGAQNIWVGGVTPMPAIGINPEQMIRKLLTIKGMHNYNYEDFIQAVTFFEKYSTTFPLQQFIEKSFPLEQTKEAFDYAVANHPFRVLITNLDA